MNNHTSEETADHIRKLESHIESLTLTIKDLSNFFSKTGLPIEALLEYCYFQNQKLKADQQVLSNPFQKKTFLKKQKEYYKRKSRIILELEILLTIRKKSAAYLITKEDSSPHYQIGSTIFN